MYLFASVMQDEPWTDWWQMQSFYIYIHHNYSFDGELQHEAEETLLSFINKRWEEFHQV